MTDNLPHYACSGSMRTLRSNEQSRSHTWPWLQRSSKLSFMCFGHCNRVWPCCFKEIVRFPKQIRCLDSRVPVHYRLCDAHPIFSQTFATFFKRGYARILPFFSAPIVESRTPRHYYIILQSTQYKYSFILSVLTICWFIPCSLGDREYIYLAAIYIFQPYPAHLVPCLSLWQ